MALTHEDLDSMGTPYEDDNVAYLQYIESQGGKGINPLSAEGLELQAKYLLHMGVNQHPFDVLRRISVNPFAAPKDRIAASRVLLEYMHRKIPASIEVAGPDGSAIQLSADALKSLSGAELDVLSGLLAKAGAPT